VTLSARSARLKRAVPCIDESMPPERKPTVKQVYAVARALCERLGEAFPETRAQASALIERLRTENGGPP
jgi:hypothetical protein